MFIVTLFIIVPNSKHPKCLLSREWIIKWCNLLTTEYYSPTKRNNLLMLIATCLNLKCIHYAKSKKPGSDHMLYDSIYTLFLQSKTIGTKKKIGGCSGMGKGRILLQKEMGKYFRMVHCCKS